MRNKKYLFFGLIIVSCICFCSCDAFLENLEKGMLDWLNENVDYEYTIEINCKNSDDQGIIETRMKALGLDIVGCNFENNYYVYELISHYPIDDQTLYMICDNPSVFIVDGDGNEILTKSNVISVSLDITSSANVVVNDDFCQMFNAKYVARIIRFIVNGETYDVDAITRKNDEQGLIIFTTAYESVKVSIKQMVIAYSSEPLSGEIELKIKKSATRV